MRRKNRCKPCEVTDALHDAFDFKTDKEIITDEKMKKLSEVRKSRKNTTNRITQKTGNRSHSNSLPVFAYIKLSKTGF